MSVVALERTRTEKFHPYRDAHVPINDDDPLFAQPPLLEVNGLKVVLDLPQGPITAVDGVDFSLQAGRTLCLVGESGCGKSLTCLALMGLLPPRARIAGGMIRLAGREIQNLSSHALTKVRGRDIAMIYQDPTTALNPVLPVGRQIAESLILHGVHSRSAAMAEAKRLLDRVGVPDAGQRLRDYPHQLSGGMNQRVMIAMALACRPKLLIADEPTTALDVTIQAQILDLLRDLQKDMRLAVILVTHDLGVVAEIADDVAVMYAGRVVECGVASQLFKSPGHPYTAGLIGCLPRIDRDGERLRTIDGVVPSLAALPAGCSFRARCNAAVISCAEVRPFARKIGPSRTVACWNPLWTA